MKRNNLAKRFGIASLCLATAISAVSGFALLNESANAEGIADVAPTSLLTADAAATASHENGLRISSDAAYEGTLNYTCKGDTTIKFTFPETYTDWFGGNFVVRVTDATDNGKYFEVEYGGVTDAWSYSYTNAWVKYNDAYYTSKYSNSATTWYNSKKTGVDTNVSPNFRSHYGKGTAAANNTREGYLGFAWDSDGKLSVSVSKAADNSTANRVIATFDDTVADGFVVGESWGLPKMTFENGYKISFSSNFTVTNVDDHATDVCFKSLTTDGVTYDLSAKTNTEAITLAARGSEYAAVAVGDELTIPTATYGEGESVESVQIVKPNGGTSNVTAGEKFTVEQAGLHTVTYTTAAGSVAAFSFTAKEYVNTAAFVHTGATVSQDSTGLLISSDDAYKATIKGVFKGDATLKFRFPETYTDWFDGKFVVRVTDVSDDSKYFEVEYAASDVKYGYTGAWVHWNNQTRVSQYHNSAAKWWNIRQTGEGPMAAPAVRSAYGSAKDENTREGILKFVWTEGVLSVQINNCASGDATAVRTLAAFDGTYDTTKTDNGFVSGTSWGLPTMTFENGYVISVSSSFENAATTDNGTDVLFTSIENGGTKYDFTGARMEKRSAMTTFDDTFDALTTEQTADGQVFLGWKNATTGELYPAYSVVRKNVSHEAVVIDYDTINGASVRIDTSADGKSGIRFQTLFDVEEYAAVEQYIQSFGTLVAWTDTLTTAGKEFTIENYDGVSSFAKVENTKGTFEYTDKENNVYTAYSMALEVNEGNYTKAYSARGYLVVEYADGSTQTIYTDYDAAVNSRSIQQVAQLLKTTDAATYEGMTAAQQAIIDAYANATAQ